MNFQVLLSFVHQGQEDLKVLSFCKSLAMGEMQKVKVGFMPYSKRVISLILYSISWTFFLKESLRTLAHTCVVCVWACQNVTNVELLARNWRSENIWPRSMQSSRGSVFTIIVSLAFDDHFTATCLLMNVMNFWSRKFTWNLPSTWFNMNTPPQKNGALVTWQMPFNT